MSAGELSWWVLTVAVAVGTVGAVMVALFGDAFRGKFFPPLLRIDLANAQGEATQASAGGGTPEPARYYHVRVWNERRWSPASEVKVVLLQVEEPGPNGNLYVAWTGDIPLGWRHQVLFPIERTIGGETFVDLCSVTQGGRLRLHPLIVPFNLTVERLAACSFVVTVQARGSEVDSTPLRVRVSWDGTWEPGTVEMLHHLTIERLDAQA